MIAINPQKNKVIKKKKTKKLILNTPNRIFSRINENKNLRN